MAALSAATAASFVGIEPGLPVLSQEWRPAGLLRWERGNPPEGGQERKMSSGVIDTSRIESMLSQLRAAGARVAPPDTALQKTSQTGGVSDFSAVLKSSLDQVNSMQQEAGQLGERFASGDTRVSLSDAMLSLQKSSIALQQTVQVRNKLVSAYQEIMNMGV
jgi:flagellar hook-basal body complex protein FliE